MIMNPSYDPRRSRLSDFDKKVLALVVEKRLDHRDQALPERAELLALFEQAPFGPPPTGSRRPISPRHGDS